MRRPWLLVLMVVLGLGCRSNDPPEKLKDEAEHASEEGKKPKYRWGPAAAEPPLIPSPLPHFPDSVETALRDNGSMPKDATPSGDTGKPESKPINDNTAKDAKPAPAPEAAKDVKPVPEAAKDAKPTPEAAKDAKPAPEPASLPSPK